MQQGLVSPLPYQLRKAKGPLERDQVGPVFTIIIIAIIIFDVVGSFCVEVEHTGNYSRRGSDIASMHSLKLYSSRSRTLSGPSCALGEPQENGHPRCWVPLVL